MTNITLEQTVVDRTKELSKLIRKLKDASEHDELTNIYNRRKFNIFLDEEYLRTNRNDSFFSLMMIDIDCFKQYNDNYGHLAGDYVLKELAQLCKSRLRPDDVLGRYGGEEFCAVLPETALDGAAAIADDLRRRVQERSFEFENESIAVTVSLGCAELGGEMDVLKILKAADEKLYEAKRGGRNKVCC